MSGRKPSFTERHLPARRRQHVFRAAWRSWCLGKEFAILCACAFLLQRSTTGYQKEKTPGAVSTPSESFVSGLVHNSTSGNRSRIARRIRSSSCGSNNRRATRRRTASSSVNQSSSGGSAIASQRSYRRPRTKNRQSPPTRRAYTWSLSPSAVTRRQPISAFAITYPPDARA